MNDFLFFLLYSVAYGTVSTTIMDFIFGATSAGTVAQAPSHLSLWRRVTYYAFHCRNRAFFVSTYAPALLNDRLTPSPFPWLYHQWPSLAEVLCLALFLWVVAALLTAYEAWWYRMRPWPFDDEERQAMEAGFMTREEYRWAMRRPLRFNWRVLWTQYFDD